MGIVTDLSIQGTNFELGSSLGQVGDVHVSFERVVPTGAELFPYMWVYTDDHPAFCQILSVNSAIENLRLVHHEDDEGLYEISWCEKTDGFLDCLRNTNAVVLQAGGTTDGWEFQLRFDCQDDISAFQRVCSEAGITLSVDRIITKSVVDPPGQKLTDPQRETIELALEHGYFDVPRQTTMVELAEQLGVSDQAVSARIRRAMKKLSQQLFLPDPAQNAQRLEQKH